jgi:hypothetical protein
MIDESDCLLTDYPFDFEAFAREEAAREAADKAAFLDLFVEAYRSPSLLANGRLANLFRSAAVARFPWHGSRRGTRPIPPTIPA